MKKFIIGLILLFTAGILLVLPACAGPQPLSGSTFISSQQEGIWVTGTGKVTVTPDLATLTLGIEAQQSNVAQAQSEATQAMNNVIAAVKAQGIADKDIQTQRFSIQQITRYDQQTQREVVVGFRVTNTVTAKIRTLDQVGTIIDAVAQAGGDLTRINGLTFSVEEPSMYYEEARTKAVEDAQKTAAQLASLTGATLGEPVFVSESTQYQPPVPISGGIAFPSAAPVAETSISPGETEITLTVQVAYAIAR